MRGAVFPLLIAVAGFAAPALAAPESGLFHDGVGGCDATRVGLADGPVRVSPDQLDAARGTCAFTGETRISRIDGASLRDATCRPAGGGETFETRFFLSFTPAGVTIVSPVWGTWALGRCP